MTDINTAALRASLERRGVIGALRTYDLCDALDAARAERDDLRKAAEGDAGKWLTTTLMRDRAEAAEARIAAALALLPHQADEALRALTGPLGKGTV